MKRILVAATLAFGMLIIGASSASAATLCTLDPTLRIGLPIQYNVNVQILGTHVYASGTSQTTTFGGVVGI
jgi:hypothetical protein